MYDSIVVHQSSFPLCCKKLSCGGGEPAGRSRETLLRKLDPDFRVGERPLDRLALCCGALSVLGERIVMAKGQQGFVCHVKGRKVQDKQGESEGTEREELRCATDWRK